MRPASAVYAVRGEDRILTGWRRTLSWAGTIVSGLLGEHEGPAVSDIVIRRRLDDDVLRRVRTDTMTEFEERLAQCMDDLDAMTEDAFAAEWLSA